MANYFDGEGYKVMARTTQMHTATEYFALLRKDNIHIID